MKPAIWCLLALFLVTLSHASIAQKVVAVPALNVIAADDPALQYTGRIDFTNPKRPRFWASGVYIQARFRGTACEVLLNDEANGSNHNYVALVVDDGKPIRVKLTGKTDTLRVVKNLPEGEHTLTICKNTESGIGYLEFVGLRCAKLVAPSPKPTRRLEFIGNSITCGTGSDLTDFPCNQGQWYDQHNAYMAYGPQVARRLNAQWQLTSVSGIGLVHSCCNMTVTMPDVFDKVNLRDNKVVWDFSRYQPDAVTICLGQNDGVQDSTTFCGAYLNFLTTVRSHYPKARLVCLTSPMADAKLMAVQKRYLSGIVAEANRQGDRAVQPFFFSRSFNSGCGGHPDLAEHVLIANELTDFLRTTLHW